MCRQDDEVERLKRIRDRQIRLRDPKAKNRAVQHKIASAFKEEKITAGSVVRDIPGRWLGTIFGGIVGIVIAVGFHLLVKGQHMAVVHLVHMVAGQYQYPISPASL